MGKPIPQSKRRRCLSFVESNFGKISQRKMAKILGVGKTTINTWSKELGLRFRKHTVNEYFFDELNELSSYILGLIYSDGNIAWNPEKGYYTITITASEKDKNHLDKIRNILSSTKPLLYSSKTKSYRLIINSKRMCKQLMSFGLTPRKSLTIDFPNIPEDQLKHFIRGVIDGDGNIRYVKRKKSPYFEITIASGSEVFCKGFVESVNNNINANANIRKVGNNTRIIQYSCSRGKRLAKYIYSDANLFLERKYLPYKNNIMRGVEE